MPTSASPFPPPHHGTEREGGGSLFCDHEGEEEAKENKRSLFLYFNYVTALYCGGAVLWERSQGLNSTADNEGKRLVPYVRNTFEF